MAASGGYSAKTLTTGWGDMSFHAKSFTYTGGNQTVDITNEDSSQKEEVALGLEMLKRGSADGFCNSTTAPVKPTAAVSVTLFDGQHTESFNAYITELTVTATVDGSCEASLSFIESIA